MQAPELLLLAAMTAAAVSLLVRSGAGYRRPFLVAALLLGVMEGWYRVAAWQLAPVWLAWLILVLAMRLDAADGWARPAAGWASLALISTSAGLLIVLPFFTLPRPTGPYAVGTRTVYLDDLGRTLDGTRADGAKSAQGDRELVVQAWYPADRARAGLTARYVREAEIKPLLAYQAGIGTNSFAGAPLAVSGGPFPVLLYGPSWGSRRTVDTFLTEELASHGYVVLAMDHPLNAARVERADGRVIVSDRASALSEVDRSGAAAVLRRWSDELTVWVADDHFVLEQLAHGSAPADPLGWLRQRVDLTRVGAFGHSFGGASSFALLGQAEQPGAPRVRAAANLDGWTFDGLARRTAEPILMIYAGEPGAPAKTGVEGELDRDDQAAVSRSITRFGGTVLYIPRTQHLDFTDQTLVSPFRRLTYTGPLKGGRVRTITRGMLVAFFDRALKGSGQPLPAYPEVRVAAASR